MIATGTYRYPTVSTDQVYREFVQKMAAGRRLQDLVKEVVKYPPQETVPVDLALTYCQDVAGKCWSAYDSKAQCNGYPGALCKVGVDWTAPANTCGVPLDVIFFMDESPSVTQTQWEEMKQLIVETCVFLCITPAGRNSQPFASALAMLHNSLRPCAHLHFALPTGSLLLTEGRPEACMEVASTKRILTFPSRRSTALASCSLGPKTSTMSASTLRTTFRSIPPRSWPTSTCLFSRCCF